MASSLDLHPQKAIHHQSLSDREAFWLRAARDIHWHQHPSRAFGPSAAAPSSTTRHGREKDGVWFPGGQLSTTFNCLDRHVYPPQTPHSPPLTPSPHTPHLPYDPALANRIALRHVSPLPWQTIQERTITYGEALEHVQVLAGVLIAKGVKKGDVVTIYMSESIETALAILAIARIGAVFSVVFGGFASKELAKRIEDSKCKMIITSSCGLEPKGPVPYKPLVDEALKICASRHVPSSGVLFFRRHGIRDHNPPTVDSSRNEWDWDEEMQKTRAGEGGRSPCWACPPVASEDPLYLLYTSGSTGTPKGVVRSAGGHAVALRYSIEHVFGMKKEGDVMLTTSSFGWVVGCSYILFGPLLLGGTSIIFEGKPILPDAGIFWRMVSNYGVTHLFTAPTALRAIRGADPTASFMRAPGINLKSLRTLFLAGERSEPQIVELYGNLLKELGAPGAFVNDNYWSTETGSPITAIQVSPSFASLSARPGSAGLPLPGMDVRIVDDEGREVSKANEMGNLVLAPPLAPSALLGLWHNPSGFEKSYWERFSGKGGWYDTGDSAFRDADGYVTICARADDLINVAAHRLGTGLIEAVVTAHPDVVECCVVGAPDSQKGQVPFAVVVVHHQPVDIKQMMKSINDHIRKEVGPIAQLGALVVTAKLPKTRSGKTLRRTIRAMVENTAEGKKDAEVPYPPTIEDKDVLVPIQASIDEHFAASADASRASRTERAKL